MHGNNGKERDENQKVQKGKEEVLLQPTPEKCASVEVSTLLSSSNLRPLLSSPSLVSDPEALTTASAPCMSKVEKDETKCNDKSETKKARPGLQVGILVSTCSPMAVPLVLCLSARFPFTPPFLFPSALQHVLSCKPNNLPVISAHLCVCVCACFEWRKQF